MKDFKAWIMIQFATVANLLGGIVVAHNLTSSEFGRFATFIAALGVMVSVLNPIINELSRAVSRNKTVSWKLISKISAPCFLICVVISILTCISTTDDFLERVLLFIILPASLVASTWSSGVLVGLNRTHSLGIAQLIGGISKLLISLVGICYFANFGFAVSCYVIGFLIIALSSWGAVKSTITKEDVSLSLKPLVVIGFFLLALPFSLDQILVQIFFPQNSGDYAAVMTYAKIVMVACAPALTIAYGNTIQFDYSDILIRNGNKLFIGSILMATSIAAVLIIASPILFPILLGVQYVHLVQYIWLGAIAVAMHVVSYFIFQTILPHVQKWILLLLIIPAIIQVYLIYTAVAPTIEGLIFISLIAFCIQFILAILSGLIVNFSAKTK